MHVATLGTEVNLLDTIIVMAATGTVASFDDPSDEPGRVGGRAVSAASEGVPAADRRAAR